MVETLFDQETDDAVGRATLNQCPGWLSVRENGQDKVSSALSARFVRSAWECSPLSLLVSDDSEECLELSGRG